MFRVQGLGFLGSQPRKSDLLHRSSDFLWNHSSPAGTSSSGKKTWLSQGEQTAMDMRTEFRLFPHHTLQ